MTFPKHLKYTETHEWVLFNEDGTALIGITDYAQDQLGDLVFVNLPQEGDPVTAGESFADVFGYFLFSLLVVVLLNWGLFKEADLWLRISLCGILLNRWEGTIWRRMYPSPGRKRRKCSKPAGWKAWTGSTATCPPPSACILP